MANTGADPGAAVTLATVSAQVNSPAVEWFADFEEFAAIRGPQLVRWARLLLQDEHEAHDVAAEVLAKVLAKWRRISHMTSPDAYVRTMLRNQCLSYARKPSRKKEKSYPPSMMPETMETDSSEEHARRDQMMRCFRELSPQQRAVMVMRHYEEMDDPEIAATLGISQATVRWHAGKARARLRELLGEEAEPTNTGPEDKDVSQ